MGGDFFTVFNRKDTFVKVIHFEAEGQESKEAKEDAAWIKINL